MNTPLATAAGRRYLEAVRDFRESMFRLETRQSYAGPGEDAAFAAFVAGAPNPPPLGVDDLDYLASVRAARTRGACWQRVHIIREPLTEYLRFELTWEYGPNVAAGEDVGLVVLGATDPWPAVLPTNDFTLFDNSTLFVQAYASDGTWLGIEEIDDRDRVTKAQRWRDVALHRARSWRGYVSVNPALERRVPTMREAS